MSAITKTADEYRADAIAHEREAAESFERCDTDGFLSQWASGINARLARAKADLAEDGGLGLFRRTKLERLDGGELEYRVCQTRYGLKYRVDATDEWLPVEPARESTLAKKGYREVEETEVGPANATIASPPGARGLSGATQCFVRTYRTDRPKSEGWRYAGSPSFMGDGDSDSLDDDDSECEGHESLDGPIGNVVYCDGSCRS